MASSLPLSLRVVVAAVGRHQLDTLGISARCTQRFARQMQLPSVPVCVIMQSKIRVRHTLASKAHILYTCVPPSNKR